MSDFEIDDPFCPVFEKGQKAVDNLIRVGALAEANVVGAEIQFAEQLCALSCSNAGRCLSRQTGHPLDPNEQYLSYLSVVFDQGLKIGDGCGLVKSEDVV